MKKKVLLLIPALSLLIGCTNSDIEGIAEGSQSAISKALDNGGVTNVKYEKCYRTVIPSNYWGLHGAFVWVKRTTEYADGTSVEEESRPGNNWAYFNSLQLGDHYYKTMEHKYISHDHERKTHTLLAHYTPGFDGLTTSVELKDEEGMLVADGRGAGLLDHTLFHISRIAPTDEQREAIDAFIAANGYEPRVIDLLEMFADGQTDEAAYLKLPEGWYFDLVIRHHSVNVYDQSRPDYQVSLLDGRIQIPNYFAIIDGQKFSFDEFVEPSQFDYALEDISDDAEKTVKVFTTTMRTNYFDYPEFNNKMIDTLVYFKINRDTELYPKDGNRYTNIVSYSYIGYGSYIYDFPLEKLPLNVDYYSDCYWISPPSVHDWVNYIGDPIQNYAIGCANYEDEYYKFIDDAYDNWECNYRQGSLTIVDRETGKKQNIIVRQQGGDYTWFERDAYDFDYAGGEITLNGIANVSGLNIELLADWITFKEQPTTRSWTVFSPVITIAENPSTEARESEIRYNYRNAYGHIPIRQKGRPNDAPATTRSAESNEASLWQPSGQPQSLRISYYNRISH